MGAGGHNAKDRSGIKVGRLIVLSKSPIKAGRQSQYLCRCDCGKELLVIDNVITCGKIPSCGCANKQWKKDFKAKKLKGYGLVEEHNLVPLEVMLVKV